MEYFRDKKNQIYVDLAYRLGKIVTQYEKFVPEGKDKFEVSLHIAVLQNLLTICKEYAYEMFKDLEEIPTCNSFLEKNIKTIDKEFMDNCRENTFNGKKDLSNFIRSIRNAVCHPNQKGCGNATGYTTIPDGSGRITKVHFIDTGRNNRDNSTIELTETDLKSLVINLANYLAQPMQDDWDWDGKTIINLFAENENDKLFSPPSRSMKIVIRF